MIMCLDYGDRYIGIATTDPEERIAVRHSVIDQKKESALPRLKALVEKEEVERVLVGVPVSLSGNETEQTHKSLAFMERLREVLGNDVAVEDVDETLTSVEADRRIKAEGGQPDDAHMEAARIMLVAYLAEKQRKSAETVL